MKIAFITESFPELSETFILGKVAELKKRGHQVTVFSQFVRTHNVHPDLLSFVDMKKEVVRLPVWDRVRPKDIGRAIMAAGAGTARMGELLDGVRSVKGPGTGRLLAFIKALPFLRNKFALIHAHYAYMGLRYMDAVTAMDMPLVVSLLGTDASIDIPGDPEPYKPLFDLGVRFIAVVEFLKDKVVEHGCDPAKVTVIPTEADTEFFGYADRNDRGRDAPVILTVGRLDWTKGYLYALEAMAALKAKGVPFIYHIIGGGRDRNSVELAIRDMALGDRVKLLGALDREGVRAAMEEADLFVLPSVIEGIGGVLLEAQATGLPVVATKVGGLHEVVKDGETGFLVPSRDPEALAEKIRHLIEHRRQRLEMGARARHWVVENFDKDMLTERLVELYEEVIEEHKAR